MEFTENKKYSEMLITHSEMIKNKETETKEWLKLQKDMLEIELEMSVSDIIKHAEICFPHVQEI